MLNETLRLGFPISPERIGYSALALVIDRIIKEDMVGHSDGLFLAKILVCCDLLDWEQAQISIRLQKLIAASRPEVGVCDNCPYKVRRS